MQDFNPRTPCGVRPCWIWSKPAMANDFNPRTPCGVRPACRPRVPRPPRFQSTHPLRGATFSVTSRMWGLVFQSTHPLRGATYKQQGLCPASLISIHAPLAGCDGGYLRGAGYPSKFQSTHPLRGATRLMCAPVYCEKFQSTHPLRGATTALTASLTGGTDFNPRTPCGVRPGKAQYDAHGHGFQSTHPLRGATFVANTMKAAYIFQSTHPLRGATLLASLQ